MANKTKKKIQLHPIDEAGKPIESEVLYPETSIDSVRDKDGKRLTKVLEDIEHNIDGLATVAYTGSATDLTDLATVALTGQAVDVQGLHPVATSGDYTQLVNKIEPDWNATMESNPRDYIKNKPYIPKNVTDLENDAKYQNDQQVEAAVSAEAQIRSTEDAKLTPKTRKVAGVSLAEDTDNLQGYTYDTNQTLAEKFNVVAADISNEATDRITADTALAGRIKTIEDDYLKGSDKTELQNNINTKANQSALEDETTDREKADINLQTNINAKANTLDVNNALDTKANQTDLEAEITRATNIEAAKVDTEINSANGKALVFNEADGGGVKFEHNDGTWSGIAVNDGGASDIAAQIYALDGAKIQQGITEGVKLNITKDKINYIKNKANNQTTAADELAVKGDIKVDDIKIGNESIISNKEVFLGTASQLNTGTTEGQIPVIGQGNKLDPSLLPDQIEGQMIYGGTVSFTATVDPDIYTTVATLTAKAKQILGVSTDTIILSPDSTDPDLPGGYKKNEGIYYIAQNGGKFANIDYLVGDWLVSTGSGWSKIANTDAVTDITINGTTILASGVANINTQTAYNSIDNKIATMQDIPDISDVIRISQTQGLVKNDGTIDTNTYATTTFVENTYATQQALTNGLATKANITDVYDKATIDTQLANKTTQDITTAIGKASIKNEEAGGGAFFESDSTKSFVGVHGKRNDNDPHNANRKYLAGQIYAKDKDATTISGTWTGTKLNLYTDGFYYTKNRVTGGETADQEIATIGDITVKGVQKNGTDLTPDANGKVNVIVPDAPIQEIQVNSTTITPDQGVVNIEVPTVDYPVTDVQVDGTSVLDGKVAKITMPNVPTKTSDLTNDSRFYQLPNDGTNKIPANDLAATVQTSLGKADTALQSINDTIIHDAGGALITDLDSYTAGNPEVTGTEPTLTSIKIGNNKYLVDNGGSTGYVPANRKVGGIDLRVDTNTLQDYKYGNKKEVILGLVDNKTYSLPLNYIGNIDSLAPDYFVIGSMPQVPSETWAPTCDILFVPVSNTVVVNLQEDWDETNHTFTKQYVYRQDGQYSYNWYVNNSLISEPIQFTLKLDQIYPGRENLAKYFLGAKDRTIEIEQTIKEKVEDLPNWVYEKEEKEEFIPAYTDGDLIKINFNVIDYLDKFPYFTNENYIYGYNGSSSSDSWSIYPVAAHGSMLYINFGENEPQYYFVPDITDTTNFGAWRNGTTASAQAYTPEELSNVTFTLDISKVDSRFEAYLPKLLLNLDGTPVSSLVDRTAYKINFNVNDYLDVFDFVYDNAGQSGGFFDVTLYNGYSSYDAIKFYWGYGSLNSLFLGGNGTYYYFYPQIGTNYPGNWYSSNGLQPHQRYSAEDLEQVMYTLHTSAIINKSLLIPLTLHEDGTPVEPDHTETYYEETSLKNKIDGYKDWEYEKKTITKTIPGLVDDLECKINFDASTYTDILNPTFHYTYDDNGDNQPCISYNDCGYFSLRITAYDDPAAYTGLKDYYLAIDLTNSTKPLAWKKGSNYDSEEYTSAELDSLVMTLYTDGISSNYDRTTIENLLKAILLNIDDTPVTTLVNNTSYKVNKNVMNYRNIFADLADNFNHSTGSIYSWGASDSNISYINIDNFYYSNTPYIYNFNNSNYYLIPNVSETYFPGRWADSSQESQNNIHYYTSQELAEVPSFSFKRANIDSRPDSESLLHKILVKADGTPVPEDHEEVIIEIKTLDDKINEPLKDKLYQVVEEEVEVPNDIINGNEYYFKDNMGFNLQTMQEYFFGLESGAYIYNNTNTGECIQYIVDETSGKVSYACARLRYYDSSSNYYDYLIANIMSLESTFINEWDGGSLDFPITIYTDYIINEDILKLMLELGTHTEIEYKNQTLEEKNADLPNWKYEYKIGFFDVPKWDKFEDFELDSTTIYENIPHLAIHCDYYNDIYSVMITDIDNDKRYSIANKEQSYSEITFKANTWYEENLRDHESLPVECDTPSIIIDKQYIIPEYEELFNAIYGENKKTLKQKIDEIEEKINNIEPLKDKIYSNSGDLVDGEEYKLKEDYTEFFDKYAHGQSTLIYGENDSPTPSPTPILADGVTAKGGDSIDLPAPDIEVPTNNPTILGIYLYTDSTPIIKDGLTRDGAIQYDGDLPAPDIPVFGGASIAVYTNQGTITFNQGGDGWYSYGRVSQKIPTEELPTLILDSSLIQNEEMLKDFIGGNSITLEEKFNEVEKTLLKDKLYDGTDNLVLAAIPDWKEIYDIVDYGENDTWYYHIYDTRYSDTGIWVSRYETARGSGVYFQQVSIWNTEEEKPKYSKYLIFNIDFYNQELGMDVIANTWYAYNTQSDKFEITDVPDQIILDRTKISTEQDFYADIFNAIIAKSITLEEKIADVKNWTYDTISSELEKGKTYPLLDTYSLADFTSFSFTSNWGTEVYTSAGGTSFAIIFALINDENVIIYQAFNGECSGYSFEDNGWFEIDGSGDDWAFALSSGDKIPVSTPTTDQLMLSLVLDEDAVKLVLGLKEQKITLDEKFNSISQFPACPTDTDGTYVLEATVSSGEVTYTWVLKSS